MSLDICLLQYTAMRARKNVATLSAQAMSLARLGQSSFKPLGVMAAHEMLVYGRAKKARNQALKLLRN